MIELDGGPLALSAVASIAYNQAEVRLSPASIERMAASRSVVDKIIASGKPIYGVNTGFGRLSDTHIEPEDLGQLQLNLVRSHACGVGEPLSEPEVRAMMALRVNVLAKGFSGARPIVAETLVLMLNRQVHPVVPSRGSVGASGDLAPLAHLAMGSIGEGESFYRGQRIAGDKALGLAGIAALQLLAKEGLALLNGTQAMVAVGSLALWQALTLLDAADVIGAMSLEALRGTPVAFDSRIHSARPHRGQAEVAYRLNRLLEGSEIRESHRTGDSRIQDAYSLRCMPQVHGAVRDAIGHSCSVLEVESGSATDNPLVFATEGDVLSGGNFHGAPVAYALDYAAIALTDMMSIVERRIDRLVNPDLNEGLPAFLSPDAGLGSGFMMLHVAAAAILSEAKVLAHPASIDSVPTSGGKEDHVSMGMTSALKLREIVHLLSQVLAIELLAAAQGVDFRAPLRPGVGVAAGHTWIRNQVRRLTQDRSMGHEIDQIAGKLLAGSLPGPSVP